MGFHSNPKIRLTQGLSLTLLFCVVGLLGVTSVRVHADGSSPPISPTSTSAHAAKAPAAPAPSSFTQTGSLAGPLQPVKAPTGNGVWNDPNNPNCKQGCTFDKANETLSLVAAYNQKKYDLLKNREAQSKQDATIDFDGQVLQELGQFCYPIDPTAGVSVAESGAACWARYKLKIPNELASVRTDIIANETNEASLMSDRIDGANPNLLNKDRGTARSVEVVENKSTPSRSGIVSYFPSFDELQAEYNKTARQRTQTATVPAFAGWLNDYAKEPTREDFAYTRQVLRDANDPQAGTFSVFETNKDGTTKVNEKAYAFAHKRWADGLKFLKDGQKDLFMNYKNGPLLKPVVGAGKIAEDGSISRQAFAEARKIFVDKSNALVTGQALPDPVPLANGKRAPAAGLGNKSTATNFFSKTQSTNLAPATGNEAMIQMPASGKNHNDSKTLLLDTQSFGHTVLEMMDAEDPTNPPVVNSVMGQDIPPIETD
jgi:hypothetical protein